MAYKDIRKQRAFNRGHYQRNKAYYINKAKLYKRKLRAEIAIIVNTYKKEHGCSKCSENDPVCIDFHHHNDDKEFCVSEAIGAGLGKARILKEVGKCTLLCANCHRKVHRWVSSEGRAVVS